MVLTPALSATSFKVIIDFSPQIVIVNVIIIKKFNFCKKIFQNILTYIIERVIIKQMLALTLFELIYLEV